MATPKLWEVVATAQEIASMPESRKAAGYLAPMFRDAGRIAGGPLLREVTELRLPQAWNLLKSSDRVLVVGVSIASVAVTVGLTAGGVRAWDRHQGRKEPQQAKTFAPGAVPDDFQPLLQWRQEVEAAAPTVLGGRSAEMIARAARYVQLGMWAEAYLDEWHNMSPWNQPLSVQEQEAWRRVLAQTVPHSEFDDLRALLDSAAHDGTVADALRNLMPGFAFARSVRPTTD